MAGSGLTHNTTILALSLVIFKNSMCDYGDGFSLCGFRELSVLLPPGGRSCWKPLDCPRTMEQPTYKITVYARPNIMVISQPPENFVFMKQGLELCTVLLQERERVDPFQEVCSRGEANMADQCQPKDETKART